MVIGEDIPRDVDVSPGGDVQLCVAGSEEGCEMLCRFPYKTQASTGAFVSCGRCLHCRINRAVIWQIRILLEQLVSNDSCFLTLTYNVENLPKGNTLVKRDYQLFLKRLRKRFCERKIRYFLTGEYGFDKDRPHYHAILFNIGISDRDIISECWSNGFIYIGETNKYTARYVAGYIMKSMRPDYQEYIGDRLPVFCVSSKMSGGLGLKAIDQISGQIINDKRFEKRIVDCLRLGNKKVVLGRYLTKKLSDKLGVDKNEFDKRLHKYQNEIYFDNLEDGTFSYKKFMEVDRQRSVISEKRYKIFNKRRM